MQAEFGEASAYQFAEIYAQWGNIPKALDWLETAYRVPDKVERKLNFPN